MKRSVFPALGFSGGATTTPCEGENGLSEKKCNSQDQKTAVRFILHGIRKSKMEIPVENRWAGHTRLCAFVIQNIERDRLWAIPHNFHNRAPQGLRMRSKGG